jgi:hypothetical protein
MRRIAWLTIVMVTSLVLAACSTKTATSPPSSPAPSASSSPASSIAEATATLDHIPQGSVTLAWSSSTKVLTVGISMVGLGPNSTHPAHIHAGTCANTGSVLYTLPPVNANPHGDASVTSTVAGVTGGIPATGWAINIHTGPGLTPADQYRPIACLDVSNPSNAATFQGTFQPAAGPGNDVTGTATLSLNPTAHTLGVSLTVQGLDPNTEHPAHVHQGSCQSQGPVIYPLPDLKSDASGAASVTYTFTGVTPTSIPGDWYVNVHNTTALSTQVGFTPLSCGNVTAGG